MKKTIFQKTNLFLHNLGYGKIKQFKEIKQGKNSEVYQLKVDKNYLILKVFKDKKRNRVKREKLFYNYLNGIGVESVIKPIGFDINYNFAIYPYIHGKKIKKIKNRYIKEIILFLKKINQKNLTGFPLAIDGIKEQLDHIKLCETKINNLKKIKIDNLIKKKFIKFLNKQIIPKFEQIKKNFFKNEILRLKKFKLLKKDMIISPSDLGFHNIIQSKNKFFFFDFEYAGLDDPIKLICDFYCQPDQNLTSRQKKLFINNTFFRKYSLYKLEKKLNIFLPFHQLKWCCIILNEFIHKTKSSNEKIVNKNYQIYNSRLNKAKIYFNNSFNNNGNRFY